MRLGAALTLDDLYQLAQITQAEIARLPTNGRPRQAAMQKRLVDRCRRRCVVPALLLARDRGRGEVLDEIERNIPRHQENMCATLRRP